MSLKIIIIFSVSTKFNADWIIKNVFFFFKQISFSIIHWSTIKYISYVNKVLLKYLRDHTRNSIELSMKSLENDEKKNF